MKKLQPLSLKHLARYLVIAGVILAAVLVITACESAGAGDGTGGVPGADPVSQVTLADSATAEDLTPFTPYAGTATAVATKSDALLLLGDSLMSVIAEVESYLDYQDTIGNPWEPTNTGSTISVTPEELMDEGLEAPPREVSVTATLVNEAIDDMLTLSASGTMGANLSWDSNDNPTSISASVNASFGTPLRGLILDTGTYNSGNRIYGGRVYGAVRTNMGVAISWRSESDPEYDYTYYYPRSVSANMAMSARLSIAISAEADFDSTTYRPVYGHLIATIAWDPTVSINITQAMLDDDSGEQLSNYLESIEVAEPTMTIDVYDDEGDTSPTRHTYTIDQIVQILEDAQVLGGGEEEILSSVITLSRALQATQGR
jgi:hypothetical protein